MASKNIILEKELISKVALNNEEDTLELLEILYKEFGYRNNTQHESEIKKTNKNTQIIQSFSFFSKPAIQFSSVFPYSDSNAVL